MDYCNQPDSTVKHKRGSANQPESSSTYEHLLLLFLSYCCSISKLLLHRLTAFTAETLKPAVEPFLGPRPPLRRLLVPSPWIIIHKHAWSCGFHHCHRHKQAADLLPHARQKVAGKHKQLRSQPVKPTAKLVPHPFYVKKIYDVCVEINWEHCHKTSTDTHIQQF